MAACGSGDLRRRLAARCGVTRLADITHLDRLGAPVFQAIRPWSQGLSVHQGKGLTREAASLGALMEAAEHHFAETFAGPVTSCGHCQGKCSRAGDAPAVSGSEAAVITFSRKHRREAATGQPLDSRKTSIRGEGGAWVRLT